MKKFYVSLLVLFAVASSAIALNFGTSESEATTNRDCSSDAVIKCGTQTIEELRTKYANDYTKGTKNIYQWFGINSTIINTYKVQTGTVYRNGDVYIGDKRVATDAMTAGRDRIHDVSVKRVHNGTTFYTHSLSVFRPASVEAFVFTDKNGKFVGAVMHNCGNPVKAKPVEPPKPVAKYECVSISRIKQTDPNKYVFQAKSSVANGAKATGFTVEFGDGKSQKVGVQRTEGKYAYADVPYTYTKAGTYNVKLTAHFTVNGKSVSKTAENCQKSVTIPEKPKPANPGVSIDKKVSADQNGSDMTKEEALEQARNFKPKGNCTTVMTPAVHVETGARYTFTSGCLPSGWVAERNYNGQTNAQSATWVEHTTVAANGSFQYRLVVKNTGDVDLKDVKVTDKAPKGVQFVSTDKGTVSSNSLNYTIPTLKVGASDTIIISAKATADLSTDSRTKNTACVDTPTVPGQPDDCDDATVDTTLPEEEQVCELKSGRTITIEKDEFDAKLHSRDFADCEMEVCVIEDKEVVTIDRTDYDESIHTTDFDKCDEEEVLGSEAPKKGEAPTVIAATGPAQIIGGLFGSSALSLGVVSYLRSRRALSDLF